MDIEIKNLMKQLVKQTAPKNNFNIVVTGNESTFTTVINPTLELGEYKKYKIALLDLETYYSFPNISEKNNIIEYEVAGRNKKIIIPVGSYEFIGLNQEIERQLKNNGDKDAFTLSANDNTFKSVLDVNPGYYVKFSDKNSMKTILGFTKDGYSSGIHAGEKLVNIITVNSIFVHINCIEGSIVNGSKTPVIYSFFPTSEPGHKIVERPTTPVYLPVKGISIRDLVVSITDQNNKPIDLRGETITIRFHLLEC